MSDYIDLITGKPLELWAEQAMKDRASSKAGAVERAREVARDLRLRLSAMGINLTDDARTAINQAFLALPTTMAGDYVMVPRADALAQALCLLDTFAGEGLAHTYGNGQVLDAADVCTELAEAYGIECEPGWWRTVADRAAYPTGGE